jgi:hypothetical protein
MMYHDATFDELETKISNLYDKIYLGVDELDLRTTQQLQRAFNWIDDSFPDLAVEENIEREYNRFVEEQLSERYQQINSLKDRMLDRHLACVNSV